jgi:hypothetical protein
VIAILSDFIANIAVNSEITTKKQMKNMKMSLFFCENTKGRRRSVEPAPFLAVSTIYL